MANFCCSIEMEPKTLNEGQLNQAREVAVDIVQNKVANDASSIFVEGLKPTIGIKDTKTQAVQKEENSLVYCTKLDDETVCQCSFTSAVIDSPADNSKLKEPVSAPF